MRFNTSLWGAIVAFVAATPSVTAQEVAHVNAAEFQNAPTTVTATAGNYSLFNLSTQENAKPQKSSELKAAEALTASPVKTAARAKAKAPTSVADLVGDYVQTYSSLTSSGNAGGASVTISAVEGSSNQILISNWYNSGNITATVDFTNKTITIPAQYIATNSNYGKLDLAFCTTSGTPDRTQNIVGTIGNDGTITITSWWGIFINEGDYAGYFLYAGYNTVFEPSNGKMSFVRRVTNDSVTTDYKYSYNVIVNQTAKNLVTVKNFANYGQTIEFVLNRDKTATIENQLARYDATNGNWYTIGNLVHSDEGKLTGYSKTITTDVATDPKKITWTNWSLLCTSYYAGDFYDASVTTDFDITYPTLSVTSLEGEGTQEKPYLIKTADDLILLSDNVKAVNEFPCTTPPVNVSTYARIYKDAYFSIENDIDLENTRFTPIGSDWQHIFAGNVDGHNHTIKGLNVAASGSYGAGGLFGRTDTVSVIKNIILDSPVVSGTYYSGCVVGWSLGTIDNCHVINPTITNSNYGTAGIVGIGRIVTNCSVKGGTITGKGGYVAAVAGEISKSKTYPGYIENSYGEDVTVVCGAVADGYPSGGVIGTLYYADAKNCWFKGLVDGYSLYTSNQLLGGVAGAATYANVDQCFSVGVVRGYDTKACLGGLIGSCVASTITNSYAAGRVDDLSSKYSGGLIGYLRAYTANNVTTQSTVKNCYTSVQTTAETYQYDRTSEYREIFGTIEAETEPVIENAYFDQKVNDKTSLSYGATTDFLTAKSGISGYDSSIWTFSEGNYPRLTKFADTEAAKFSASAIITDSISALHHLFNDAKINALGNTTYALYRGGKLYTTGNYTKIVGDSLKIGTTFGTDTLYVVNGSSAYYLFVKASPISFSGNGSKDDPYLIQTKDDLIKLSKATTNGKQLFQDIYFKITNDIDLENDSEFVGICTNYSDAHNKFAGTIDGDGHTIHNMDIVAASWTSPIVPAEDGTITINTSNGLSYKGFIGRLDQVGTVKNLNIAADCNFNGVFASTGALVGTNEGLVENCKNYADIAGYSCWIGGIVGQNSKGTIRNCYNEGNITSGYFNVGGISATNTGIVENCANSGNISCKQIASNFPTKPASSLNNVGGIGSGPSGGITRNCLNVGTISGNSKVGGITGTLEKATSTTTVGHNDVTNCISYGPVWSNDLANVGAISGTFATEGEVKNNYYDSQITYVPAAGNLDVDGMSPVETSVLTSGKALENFDTDLWQFDAGQYPVLKQFASEPKLAAARKTIVKVPEGITFENLSANATLASDEGLTWKLAVDTVFTIKENTLVPPTAVSEVTADTLTATYGTYVKIMKVQRTQDVPLSGKGTETDPYIISNVKEWNAFANFTETVKYTFEDEFIKLTADIDFDGAEIAKPACDGSTKFSGTFDGNGKTLSNYKLTPTANYQGLFGIISAEGTVKDLTVAGTVSSAYTYTGGIVSKLYGKLINCVNTGKLTATKAYLGGLIGIAYKGSEITDCVNKGEINRTGSAANTAGIASYSEAGVTFTRCGNEADITNSTAGSYTAGIVGTSLPSTYIDCYNTGDITNSGATTSACYVAGIIAYANGVKDSDPYIIKGCYNTGDLTGSGLLGGIVANCGTTAGNAKLNIDDCFNTGDIVSTSTKAISAAPSAGIVAKYSAGTTINNCYNAGTIINNYNVYSAGIAGYHAVAGTADYPIVIKNCHNEGKIVATGNQGAGIIAYQGAYFTVDSCYNVGSIEGGWGLGGITSGLATATATLKNSWNAGKITTSQNRAGGVVAYNTPATTIDNCWNLGDVSTTLETKGVSAATATLSGYGIGGIAGTSGSVITNCYNVGTVTGASQVGGIVGQTVKAKTQLVSCYNAGKIVADADTCGALVGVKLTDNGSRWTDGNDIKNCYYVSDYNNFTNTQLGTSVKISELAKLAADAVWTSADDYSFPILKGQATNPAALVGSAAVVLSGDDTYDNVTSTVHVGTPSGVEWTSSIAPFSVSDNEAKFGTIESETPVTLTVAIGDITRAWNLVLKSTSGINDINANGKTIVDEVYYDLSGRVVPKPTTANGQVYIVKVTYDDNTIEVAKVINK
jgi:hypothetical protein